MKLTSASLRIGTAAGIALTLRSYRRWHLQWGATDAEAHQTRLITRVRARYDWSDPFALIWVLLMELGDFPMMRKQLLGIKRRVERQRPAIVVR